MVLVFKNSRGPGGNLRIDHHLSEFERPVEVFGDHPSTETVVGIIAPVNDFFDR